MLHTHTHGGGARWAKQKSRPSAYMRVYTSVRNEPLFIVLVNYCLDTCASSQEISQSTADSSVASAEVSYFSD